eukprot:4900003-Prymnesium_polylepis.1
MPLTPRGLRLPPRRQNPPPKYQRLTPGGEVRLRYGYVIKCEEVIKDADGAVVELRCTHEPCTRQGGKTADGRKVRAAAVDSSLGRAVAQPGAGVERRDAEGARTPIGLTQHHLALLALLAPDAPPLFGRAQVKGIIHWISEQHCARGQVNLYDRLFVQPSPGAGHEDGDFLRDVNPDSLQVLTDCAVESYAAEQPPGTRFQFERTGYFCTDKDSSEGALQFNRIVTLRDTWATKA